MMSVELTQNNRILTVDIDEKIAVKRHPEIERERQVALKNMLFDGEMTLDGLWEGPYHLSLSIMFHNLSLLIRDECKINKMEIKFSLKPYRRIIKDYFIICESYNSVYALSDHRGIESIDMARRALHDEGAKLFQDRLVKQNVVMDLSTARNLFTLICIMHIGGVTPW